MRRAAASTEGILALLGVQLCFGLFPLFVHWAAEPLHGFEPRAIVFWRIVVGAAVLGLVALVLHPREMRLARDEVPRLFACAFLGVAINMGLAMEGMSRTSVIHAGLLVTQIPVFTYLIAWLAGQERWRARRALGIAVACAGAALLVGSRASGSAPRGASMVGPLLMVANCLSYAGYLVLARSLLARHPLLVVLAWVFLFSLLALPLLALGTRLWPAESSARALTGLGYGLFFPTVLAYLLNAYALARVPASTTAVFIYLQPIIAGAAAVLVAGERVLPAHWVAAALSFAGVWLVVRPGADERAGTSDGIQERAGRVFHSRR